MAARDRFASPLFHLAALLWILAMLGLGVVAPRQYEMLLQEDRAVEWATVWLFAAAGGVGFYGAARDRRLFDALVALFCLFVAGEEFSWGQRLLGFSSPEYFLANNFQQEFNLHNLPQSYLPPGTVLMAVLGGYGVLLPALSRWGWPRALMARIGATPAPLQTVPWFAAGLALLAWYPLTLTGEWVEAFSGGLFLASTRMPSRSVWITLALAASFGVAMPATTDTLERGRDGERTACARDEAGGLVADLVSGDAATASLWQMRRVHKRIWSSADAGYLERARLERFDAVACRGMTAESIGLRRRYGIDPWGSPYWLTVEKTTGEGRRVSVYSFGPNRRRDLDADAIGDGGTGDWGDDLVATAAIP